MEALIYRTPNLPLLVATGLFLFGGAALHAQSESTPKTADPDLDSAIVAQQQLSEDFKLYKRLLMNGMTTEADVVAKRIVELSIRVNGFESRDTAKALTNLAIVQHRNQDYETAQQNYEAVIGIIERVEDRLSAALINPLRGMGSAQLAAGRPGLALDTFGRARHVSHVNEGPHNIGQVPIIESLAEIYIYIGEFDDAYKLQDRIYELYAHKYDASSDDIIPALFKRAEWQHRLRLYGRERDTYRRIIKIIERNHSKHELALIRPLTGLANAYLFVGEMDRQYDRDSTLTTGEVYVKRAKRIAEEHPDASWAIKEKTYLSLADFYIYSDKAAKAKRAYQDTWDLLSEDESRLTNRYDHLESTVLLQGIHPPKYYRLGADKSAIGDNRDFEQGRIVTKFTVNTRGRARNFEIIESFPGGLADMEKSVLREMRRLIYRPRLEDREIVDTQNLTYTHEFYYRASDLKPAKKEQEPEAPAGEEKKEVADAGD